MRIYRIVLASFTLTFIPVVLQAAESQSSADNIYREAVLQETTTRDLEKAIELYKKTLQQSDSSRDLQSNAYLRMGICYRTLGHNNQAREVWNKVVQDFSDQPATYQEARNRLQELSAEEGRTAEVQPSSPTVVYAIPKTRWELQLLRTRFNPSQDTFMMDFPSLAYFYKPNRAFGLEGTYWSEHFDISQSLGPTSSQGISSYTNIYSMAVTHLWETPIGNQLRPYLKVGPAVYKFQTDVFDEHISKFSPGLLAETGITIGWSRGFILTLGYVLNTFYQPSLDDVIGSSIRGVSGVRFSLGYRW